jgi:peptide/nickel transport system permease protein
MASTAGHSPGRYLVRRCLLAASTLLGVSVLTFVLLHLAPGDRAEVVARRNTSNAAPTVAEVAHERKVLGLDRPLAVQYERWLVNALHGDLGTSDVTRRPVRTEIAYRFPYTLRLALPAALLALVVSIPAGIVSAMFRNGVVDQMLRIAAVAGASVPSFWLGLILINVMAVHLRLVPAAGAGGLRNLILPVVTLAVGPAALLMRVTRASVVEALGEGYVRTATAKGLARDMVIERHVFPNCLVSLLTVFGNLVGRLLVGAVIVETIFAWPGIGMLLLNSINQQDYPVVVGVVLLAGVVFVILNLIVDLAYGWIDPRIDVSGRPVTGS